MKYIFPPSLLFVLFLFLSSLQAHDKAIVFSGVNGLCNRLRVLASCEILAESTDRKLLVYWSLPEERPTVGYADWKDLFAEPALNYIDHLPSNAPLYKFNKEEIHTLLSTLNLQIALEPYIEEDPNIVLLYSNSAGAEVSITIPEEYDTVIFQTIHNIKPNGMSNEEFYQKKREFYDKLVPVPYVQDAVKRIAPSITEKTVGVHIRTTDLLKSIGQQKPAYEKYQIAMREELKKDPSTNFYLCTDSKEILYYFQLVFFGKILHNPAIEYHANGSDCSVKRNTIQAQRDALVDLILLSKTRKLIGTKYSSFSYEAACMGGIPMVAISHD